MSRPQVIVFFTLSYLVVFGILDSRSQIISIDTSKNISRSSGDDMAAEWSPDGEQLIYQSNRNGNWDIFLYDFVLDTTIQLTYNSTNEQNPQWHPLGYQVVYDSGKDADQFLYLLNMETGTTAPLFDRKIICKQASLAPDGRMVYFLGFDEQNENWELFSYHLIYDNLNQLTNHKNDGLVLDLSPDGKKVLYTYSTYPYPFYRMQIFNWYGDVQEEFDDFNIIDASWHPDGLKIYFISDKDQLEGELYSIWKDETHIQRLTYDEFQIRDICFSPDGKTIACSVSINGNFEIIIIPLETF